MKIVVASGKGGVGKSMLASSLALLFARETKVVACDCDVDAPNLALWLGIKKMGHAEKLSTGEKAFIDHEKCTRCGRCSEVCKFDAISEDIEVIQFFCEGCGACSVVCPVDAIRLKPVQGGEINVEKRGFPIVSGQLYPGESGSGKIVSEVRKKAEGFKYDVMVIDSAAGIGCPVIASIKDVDFAVLVTEPTPAGFSDMKRMVQVVNHFQTPYGVVVNRWDINREFSKKIERWASRRFLGHVRHSMSVVDAIVKMRPVLETDSEVVEDIVSIFKNIKSMCQEVNGK